MSFTSCARSVLALSGRVLRPRAPSRTVGRSLSQTVSRKPAGSLGLGLTSQRPLSRSMWYMCRAPESSQSATGTERVLAAPWTKTCGCCGLHTEGDKDLAEFLADEIKYEQKSERKNLPKIKGFEVTKSEGTLLELTNRQADETIVIKFNVNNTVDDDSPMEFKDSGESATEAEAQMVSRPPFIVEITKNNGQTLALQCAFPLEKYPDGQQQEADYEDLVEIEEVALLDKDQKWEETSYVLSGANMDANLYDMLLNMIEERGITEEFVNELVEFSTAYEHKQYLGFLQNLEGFVSCK